ncbi:MAG: alpha/beta hydrolase [Paracoccaceae bacterium]|nr:alpha/beta hydrolase [Paracoccaceae bacterium]MDE3121128.1 alpha/beta hydrolase [Paracoccaceae bacterium]MDE3238784.1 alpha/beta hydrolase [Paracoccaceae bacterium]
MTAPDYDSLIDAETWAFIRETDRWYPPETATYSIDRQREIYNAMCRAFFQGYPEGVTATDRALGGVPCRIYETGTPAATVVYFHGGGFVVGGLDSHDDVCAEICAATQARVVSVDYRLAPEHKHPAAFNDSLAATRAVLAALPGPIVLAGDSAGGGLAAAVSHALMPEPRLAGQVLIYPGLGGDVDRGSYRIHENAPMLTRNDVLFYRETRYEGGEEPPDDVTAAPLWAPSFEGLPPTVAFSAECDPLADDARHYCGLIGAEGGRAHWVLEPGLVHGYLRARRSVARARESFARITDALGALCRGDWPYGGDR